MPNSIQVNTTQDQFGTGANCSLREAIQAINTATSFGGCAYTPGDNTIQIIDETYQLSIAGTGEDANATGVPTPTFALTTAPAGMTINSSTGVVRWTPAEIGDFNVVIEATNSTGSATQPYTITVSGGAPVFTSTPITTGTYGQLYTYDANTSGYPPAVFTLTTFPTGMTIDPVTGLIQWTPGELGDFDVVIEATNSVGTATQPFTITVGGAAPAK